ncbi:hypothetical protein ARD30_01325 [Bosea thiooxidans]|nr:hypothetical protein [Bosea thiooxidans]KQK32448.1 hypothetical protein ARD30_01325 [Bosea thiooxidans]
MGFACQAAAAERLFPDATETDDQLKQLYDGEGDLCLRNPSRDVRVAVACKAMTIYGIALNERGWCYGRENEANAEKDWHRCGADSDRFELDRLTDFGR